VSGDADAADTEMPQRMGRTVATVDVGGMSIKRGIVDLGTTGPPTVNVLPPCPIDAMADSVGLLEQLRSAIGPLLDELPVTRSPAQLAVAFPGPMDYDRGVPLISGQRKFDSIYGVDLRSFLTEAWSGRALDVSFVNDAEAAVLGEHAAGAACGSERLLMLTLGTGLGAAALIKGRAAAHLGGHEVGQLFAQSVEDLGRADDVVSAVGLAALLGVRPDDVADAADSARRGSQATHQQFAAFGERLGRFLCRITRDMNLDVIVVGGGAAHAFDLFGPACVAELEPEVRCAQLGSGAALIGAAIRWR
jgi:glucokinase